MTASSVPGRHHMSVPWSVSPGSIPGTDPVVGMPRSNAPDDSSTPADTLTDQLQAAQEAVQQIDLNALDREDAKVVLDLAETLDGLARAYSDESTEETEGDDA